MFNWNTVTWRPILMRGATAYEMQFGPLWVRYVHLNGEWWGKRWPWQRLGVTIADNNGYFHHLVHE
jgi:hypothetical protein